MVHMFRTKALNKRDHNIKYDVLLYFLDQRHTGRGQETAISVADTGIVMNLVDFMAGTDSADGMDHGVSVENLEAVRVELLSLLGLKQAGLVRMNGNMVNGYFFAKD